MGHETFFGDSRERLPNLAWNITNFDIDLGDLGSLPTSARRILTSLDLATRSRMESKVDDFARDLLILMDYNLKTRTVSTRTNIDLIMCGYVTSAQTDVCVEVLDGCEGNTADEATIIDYSKTGANKR